MADIKQIKVGSTTYDIHAINSDGASRLTPVCLVGSDSAGTNGWYKVATSTLSGWGNQNILYFVKCGYSQGYAGILNLEMRSNNTSIQCWRCSWVARDPSIGEGSIKIVIDGMTWTMYVYNPSSQYGRVYFTEISNRSINGGNPTWPVTYFNGNSTKETTEPVATETSKDGFIVSRAKNDKDGNAIDTTYLKTSGTAANSSKLNNQEASYYLNYNNLTNKPTIPTDTNQKIKAGSVTFGNNDVVDIVAGSNTTVTGLASGTGAPKITISATDTGATSIETTGSGNVVNSASYDASTRKITLSKGVTALTSHQSIKTLKTDNTTAQTASSSEAIAGSGTINLHKVAKTGSYNDLLNKPTIPTDTNQTIKGNGTAFGANDAINLVGGTNIAVTPDTTNKKITVGVSYPKVTYSNFATNGWHKFVEQTDYLKPFYAHLKIYVSSETNATMSQMLEIKVFGRNNFAYIDGVASTRSPWSGANSGIYYLRAYNHKDVTSTYANYKGGVELTINGTAARDIEIEIFELQNCTVLNTLVASTYNSTYHNSSQVNACVNGLTGMDLNDNASSASVAYALRINGPALFTSKSVGVGRYTLLGYDAQRGDAASITSTFNSTGTSHVVNTTTVFHFGTHICYNNAGTDYAASTDSTSYTLGTNQINTKYNSIDLRYSCNCGSTGFTKNKPLYIRITPDFSTGTFTIHSDSLTQTLTNGGYYIYLGIIRNDNAYGLTLVEDQRMYYYNGTNLIEIVGNSIDSSKLNGQEASYYLNYNNLSNKPTIPSVSNATITVKQTGISDQTFTLNGSATTITLADTNTWRPIGTGATDAAAGNHAHGNITNTGTITSTAVTSATGFLVYDSNNKIQRATSANARTILGAGTYSKPSGGIPASDLAETYYLASNPNGYTSVTESTVSGWGFTKNAGTVTSVDSTLPVNGNVALNAVSYASQTLTDTQKTQARTNIGAGTSNFTGYTSSNKLSTDYINNVAGWTSNAGTVTSVRVQAGTGLSSSTSTAQTSTLNTTISIASGYKLPTATEWSGKADDSAVVHKGTSSSSTDEDIYGVKTFKTYMNATSYYAGSHDASYTNYGNGSIAMGNGGSPTTILTLPTTTGTLAITSQLPTASYSSGLQISTGRSLYVPYATADQYGVVKPAAVRSSAITATTGGTTSNRYYGVEKDSNGKLFVNVPWSSSGSWNPDWGYTLKSYQGATFGNCYFIDCPGSYCFGCGDSGFFIDASTLEDGASEEDNMLLVNRDKDAIIINRNHLSSIGLWDSSAGSWTSYWSLNFPSAVGDAGTFALGEKTCGFARCTTSYSTAVKEVALYNESSDLVNGSMFFLDMNEGNTSTSMSFSIGGLKTFSLSNIYVNNIAMSSTYYAFPAGEYLCYVKSSKLYCYPVSIYYYSPTPSTSTSTSNVIYKGTFSTNDSVTAIATMFHNFKKVVTVYGTEASQYGTVRIYRGSSEIVAQATGEQGYWAKQDLCLTAIIPAGVDAYLYKTKMGNLTYHVEVIS